MNPATRRSFIGKTADRNRGWIRSLALPMVLALTILPHWPASGAEPLKAETVKAAQSGGPVGQAQPVMSTVKRDGVFVTEGYIDTSRDLGTVASVLERLDDYRLWALRGLDGSDKIAASYIGLFKDFGPLGEGQARVVYDVVLPWPLGSEGNIADFDLVRGPLPGQMSFTSVTPSIAYRRAAFHFWPEAAPNGRTRVRFRLEVEFAWFVDSLLPVRIYDEGVAWRASTILKNLAWWLGSIHE